MRSGVLTIDFYDRDVTTVAAELIGKRLCRHSRSGLTTGRIVETEAYLASGDSASHAFPGVNRKNASMFGPAGRAYVYTIHARQCVNVVTEPAGVGAAVLIRAVEPLAGIPLMQQRRGTHKLHDLCRGPARLCEAFEIGRELNHWNLVRGQRLWIAHDSLPEPFHVKRTVRIGVTSAHHQPLRFILTPCAFVSGPRWLNAHE